METRAGAFLVWCALVTLGVEGGRAFECDFESECGWIRSGQLGRVSASNLTGAEADGGPATDSTGNANGHFLYLFGSKHATTRQINITSPTVLKSDSTCRLVFFEHSVGVPVDAIKIVVVTTTDKLSTIVGDKYAHGTNRWEKIDQRLGERNSPFQVVIEFVPADENSHLAIDDVRLENCFPDPLPSSGECDLYRHFDCGGEKCIERSHVCDLHVDCTSGADETQECEKIPHHAKCNFEADEDTMCGWSNDQTDHLDWIRHQGPLDASGPLHDYTYKNSSGHYLYLNMKQNHAGFGSNATLNSASFQAPPKYHGQIHSPFYNSCQIRFAYFMFGMSSGALALNCIEKPPRRDEKGTILWRKSGKQKDGWIRATVPLPKLLYSYRLQFVGSRGLRNHGYIALDDVTLSPECFGIGVNLTDEEKQGGHRSKFANGKVIFPATLPRFKFETCGAKGRFGPTGAMCNNTYSRLGVTVDVLEGRNMSGIQVWTVNKTGFYSVIAQGAGGGKGARTAHTSHGARAHAVLKWRSGDAIHIVVGQEGSSTCQWGHCSQPLTQQESGIRGLAHLKAKAAAAANAMNRGSGGGGGGATYVFQMDDSGRARPLLVAAGGGGFSLDDPMPETVNPDGRGRNASAVPRAGAGPKNGAGGGGGWSSDLDANASASHPSRGLSLLEGAVGGPPCAALAHWEANGGFGGGGGACHSGGGGGGYVGGDVADPDHSEENGQGGVSWAPARVSGVATGLGEGPGVVDIFPAFEGCGCRFLCVVLDWDANEHSCICDENWQLASDNVSCTAPSGVDRAVIMGMPRHLLIILLCVVVLMICIGTGTFFLYHRYRRQKVKNIRQELFGNAELQLNRLRQQTGGMVTEYNPNYEFGGSTCTIQDLKEIPRESLTLVKALGQGAFGEVYQGCLHNLPGETRDLPVAVKTLPELSSSQAEMDFLMEALIMSKFNHANIVRFIGVCFEKLPKFIVLELLPGGDLKSFLRESRPKPDRPSPLNMCDLLRLAIDVARGCQYLEENHFIHRDIAARNCLLSCKDVNGVVKIADFGMARDIYRADYYRKGGKAMLPVKWMPPEAFLDGIFTSKTDVWSFGVLLWEVMSLGYMPYPGRGNQEVMQLVTSGGRLEPPNNCPCPVYHIMVQCWTSVPDDRPNFSTILERLGYCLQDPDVISAALPVFHRPPSMERDTTVMRPPESEDRFLHVQRTPDSDLASPASTDYLIPIPMPMPMPMPASNYSFGTDRTERTDLTSSVDSIDKLLELDAPNGKKRSGGYTSIPTFDEAALGPANNAKTPTKSGLALDPSVLAKQLAGRPFPYMNVAANVANAASATKEQKHDPFIIGNHFTEKPVNC